MKSFVDTFSLRTTNELTLSLAMSYAFAEFNATAGRATNVRQFHDAATVSDVHKVLTNDARSLIEFMLEEKLVISGKESEFIAAASPADIARKIAEGAECARKLASAVLLHAAIERFLWSTCRIGAALNRAKILEWIGERQVRVSNLLALGSDRCVDEAIEQWLLKLDRETCLDKWDRFVGLFGLPPDLIHLPKWDFSRKLLEQFDSARHDGVHHSGTALAAFELDEFQMQLSRAVYILLVQIYRKHKIQLFPQAAGGTAALDALTEELRAVLK